MKVRKILKNERKVFKQYIDFYEIRSFYYKFVINFLL